MDLLIYVLTFTMHLFILSAINMKYSNHALNKQIKLKPKKNKEYD